MIDIENEVFTAIATALRAEYNPIGVYGEWVPSPAIFPAVTVEELDNYALERTQDSGSLENHVGVMYEINVFSNLTVGKKAQAKSIFKDIDAVMAGLGFTRTVKTAIPNLENATIYRMVGRYKAVVSKDKTIFRR
jgi:hypothetical protein